MMNNSSSDSSYAEGDHLWTVEKIVGKKSIKGKIHYHVKWLNYPSSDNTWEPRENLAEECKQLIKEYKDSVKATKGKFCTSFEYSM
jgi:hypothetical protein